MRLKISFATTLWSAAAVAFAVASLTGCGGGGSDATNDLTDSPQNSASPLMAETLKTAVETDDPIRAASAALPTNEVAVSEPGYWVRFFNFTDARNYFLRTYYSTNVPNLNGRTTYFDERTQVLGGTPLASPQLYDSALFATVHGWRAFTSATPNFNTSGSPSTSIWSYGYAYTNIKADADVSGQPLARVVTMAQSPAINTASTLVGVNADRLSGTMPAGAKVRRITSIATATSIAYRVSDGTVGAGVTSLASLIAAFPVPTTPTASNTASMGGLHGSAGCGAMLCPQERLRVAFGPQNAAAFYLCDIDTSTNVQSNCGAIGSGSYKLGTAIDGVTPVMKFAGLPSATSAQTFTRVFVERSKHVYFGWKDKLAAPTTMTRLNKVAFEALAAALGITPPTITDTVSAFAGTWSASYTGADTGSCATVAIDATGHLSGACASASWGGSFVISGVVASDGAATFTASGPTHSGAVFTGSFSQASGSGSWNQPSNGNSGMWSMTKP